MNFEWPEEFPSVDTEPDHEEEWRLIDLEFEKLQAEIEQNFKELEELFRDGDGFYHVHCPQVRAK
jgi:hypothetical protein